MSTILALIFASQVQAAPVKLLEYKFGNTQEGSTLTILSDGTIHHGERTCCPARTEQITETSLTAAQLKQLQTEISAANNGMLKAQDSEEKKSNSKHGSLFVYMNSRPIIILEVEPVAGRFSVTTNQAPEAASILKFVTNYTKVDP